MVDGHLQDESTISSPCEPNGSGELTSSPKGNDAHLRAIIQSEKKWKHQIFRRLRAARSVVRGRN